MADRPDAGEPWVTEEIRTPGAEHDQPGGSYPHRPDGVPPTSRTVRSARADERYRRQRRQTLTFLAFFSMILLLGVLALVAYFGHVTLPFGSGRPVALPACPAPSAAVTQAPGETSVKVFNASKRNGLALSVARELQKRGFLVPTTPANDPQKTKMTTMAVIRHGPTGLLGAQTVAGVVAGEVTYVEDERPGSDVDLVLGATFKLAPLASPSPSGSAAAPGAAVPSPTCVPAS